MEMGTGAGEELERNPDGRDSEKRKERKSREVAFAHVSAPPDLESYLER